MEYVHDIIDMSHKSHSASDKYPKMHHFVAEMCTHVHILLQCSALWDIYLMHCGIYETDILWLVLFSLYFQF